MNATQFEQRPRRLSEGGNLINSIMTHNASVPKVGEGMTEILYSDRHVWEVTKVSNDLKRVTVQKYSASPERPGLPMGHQDWELTLTEHEAVLVWRRGAWYFEAEKVVFTEAMRDRLYSSGVTSLCLLLTDEQREQVYAGEAFPKNVVAGITRATKEYTKVRVLFGVKEYYHDWEF